MKLSTGFSLYAPPLSQYIFKKVNAFFSKALYFKEILFFCRIITNESKLRFDLYLTPEGGDGAREEAQAKEEDDLVHVSVCPLMRCGDTGTMSGGHIIRVGDRAHIAGPLNTFSQPLQILSTSSMDQMKIQHDVLHDSLKTSLNSV